MSPQKKNYINEKKTGLLFFAFLLVVTLFLAFAFWNQDEESDQANQTKNEQVKPANVNQGVQENTNQTQEAENSNTNSKLNSNTNSVQDNQIQNSDYNFSFDLLENETVVETEAEDIHTFHLGENNKITVLSADMLNFVKSDNGAIAEEAVTVDGVAGERVTGVDARDGTEIEFIVVVHGDQLYDFHGLSDFLNRVISSFKFTN